MTTKRRNKRMLKAMADLSQPTAWRRQHGDFEPPTPDVDPDTGGRVTHHRAIDTLGMMLANGTITREMHDAGTLFRTLFRSALLGPMGASSLARLPGKSTRGMSDHHFRAQVSIREALDVLGGQDGAAGSCAWHVLGCELSVREWAMRQGWGGRLVPPTQAQGMLVATLTVLAAHFAMLPRRRAA